MIYHIQNQTVSAAIDSKGAQLISLKKGETEYIWQRDPRFWSDCAPVLFPVVGRLRDGVLRIGERDYPMPTHGFVKDSELCVTEQTEESVTFCLCADAESERYYPWAFAFYVTYRVEENTLHVSFRVENRDQTEMLFGLGGHPGFRVPMEDGASFEEYRLIFEKEERLQSNICADETIEIYGDEKKTVVDGGRSLDLKRSLFNGDALIFEDIVSRSVDLVHRESGKGIRFAYGDFPILAVWTRGEPQDAPYLCLEPWYSMGFRRGEGTRLEEKYGIRHLKPNAAFEDGFSVEIID